MNSIRFDGRVAVVTGAGNGLGRSYAMELARHGASVVVNDLGCGFYGKDSSPESADRVVDEIKAAGGRAVASYDSVSTRAGGSAIIQRALDAFGRIDIVINNAGNQRNGLFEDLTDEMIDPVLETHLKGAFYVTQPAYREMKKQGYGRILFVGSQSAVFGNPCRANYSAAKGSMIGLMNVVAIEGAPHGIIANVLLPNAIVSRPAAVAQETRPDAAFLAEASKHVGVFKDSFKPEFVAPMAAFLVSEACKTSQGMYSVLGNRYARVFIGLPPGWLSEIDSPPSIDDIRSHLPEIEGMERFTRPLSGLDEMKAVAEQVRAQR